MHLHGHTFWVTGTEGGRIPPSVFLSFVTGFRPREEGQAAREATLEASRFAVGRCYAAFDGHRSDDDRPHVFVTEDFGQSWKSLGEKLPPFGSTRCLREDVDNTNLLYCGTEFGIFASLNRGESWTKLNNNLPTVAVHEIAVHPTAGEIVAATHGRSLWVLDVTALRQMAAESLKATAKLYRPNVVTYWKSEPERGSGQRRRRPQRLAKHHRQDEEQQQLDHHPAGVNTHRSGPGQRGQPERRHQPTRSAYLSTSGRRSPGLYPAIRRQNAGLVRAARIH